jgi:hypothetical protein
VSTSDWLQLIGYSILATIVGFIPAEVFGLIWLLASPEGFWQQFAMGVGGIAVLGTLQLIFFVVYAIFVIALWHLALKSRREAKSQIEV